MKRGMLCLLMLLACLVLRTEAQPRTIVGIQSGIEVTNQTQRWANGFHLVVTGVPCEDVVDTRAPLGWTTHCESLPDGSTHLWWTSGTFVAPGIVAVFGLELTGSPDWRVVCAYWTYDGSVLFPLVTWPNQRWSDAAGQVVDIVNGFRSPVNPSVTIFRGITSAFQPHDLPNLVNFRPQSSFGPEFLPNVPDSCFDISMQVPGYANAAVVSYEVYSPPNTVQVLYTSQTTRPGFYNVFTDMWFEVPNRTNTCVNEFHVVMPGGNHVNDYTYQPPGWGMRSREVAGGGVDIRWYRQDGSCVPGVDGLGFRAGIRDISFMACYWAWNGVPVFPFVEPVSQSWLWDGPNLVHRVCGYPPLVEPQGVTIQRDFALQPVAPLLLSQLDWDQCAALPWLPADPAPQWIPPDSSLNVTFTFPSPAPSTASLLSRYEVTNPSGVTGLRFVNQALLSEPPIPPINDLTIAFMGEETPELGWFRLSWTPPLPDGTLLEYRIIGLESPWDPTGGFTYGYTVDSFFDVFLETYGRTQAPPAFFRVASDYLPPAN